MNRRGFLAAMGTGLWAGREADLPWGGRSRGLDGERLVERWSWVMGQPVRIVLFSVDESAGLEAAALALAELRRVEAVLSLFDPGSDLVALNQRAGGSFLRVAPDVAGILRSAEAYRRGTGGAFDVAVEPLMQAWGFRQPRSTAPSQAELAAARKAVASTRVELRGDRVALRPAHARLDLGGIGVGYGLDRAGEVVRRAGVRRAMLDISGDLLALGAPPGRAGWPVDIAQPTGTGVVRSILLRDAALATSANTMSRLRYGDVVCGHVLDPRIGRTARAFRQVTVTAKTALAADALSTAMLVSGRRPEGVSGVIAQRGPPSDV
jgi:thiamine biosynthesis lipoprotein